MPCFAGVMILSTPIMKLLYPNEPESAGAILFTMSFTIVLIALLQTFTAILQAIGKPMIPVINLMIASIFKLLLTYLLTSMPSINVKGAAIGTAVAYIIAMILDYLWIKKLLKVNFNLKNTFLKPFIISVVMGASVYLSYTLLSFVIPSPKINTLLTIMVGGAVYLFELLFLGGISKKELMNMPGGKKLGGC